MILNNIDNVYIGASEADKIYLGSTEIWSSTPSAEIITFADPEVESVCVANWDTNGDGYLDTAEAAAVLSLDDNFDANSGITSFNELRYFTGVEVIEWAEFDDCESLEEITIPENVVAIGDGSSPSFGGCTSLRILRMLPTTPPTLGNAEEFYDTQLEHIYVPAESVNAYKTATNWEQFNMIISAE